MTSSNSPEQNNVFQMSFRDIDPKDVDKASKEYRKIMDAIDTSLSASPDDPTLAQTKEQIEAAKEAVVQTGSAEKFRYFEDQLRDASGWLNLTMEEGESKASKIKADLPSRPHFPDERLPLEREAGLARPLEPTEVQEFADQFDRDQISQILRAFLNSNEVSEHLQARLGQIDIIYQILASELANIENSRTKTEWLKQALTEKNPATQRRKKLIEKALDELQNLPQLVMQNPDKMLNNLLSPSIKIALKECSKEFKSGFSPTDNYTGGRSGTGIWVKKFIGSNGDFVGDDPQNMRELQMQYKDLLSMLRESKDYNAIQRLIEDNLLAPYFEKKMKEISKDRDQELKREAHREATKLADKYMDSWEHPSTEMIAKGAVPCDTPEKIEAERTKLVYIIWEQKKKEEAGKMLTLNDFSGFDRDVYEIYNDMLNPHSEWFNMKDSTWDTIIDEIAINAPLIVISGGVASVAREGFSLAARTILSATKFAGFVEKAGLAGRVLEGVAAGAAGVEKTIEVGRIGRAVYGLGRLGGRAVAAGLEATVFEGTYMGVSGKLFYKQEGWVKNILWTAATLGTFKFTKTQATALDKFLKENITKFPDKSFKDAMEKVFIHGSTETATMLAIGAVRYGFENGSFQDYKFEEELFRALLSVGALHIAGFGAEKAIKIGGKKIEANRKATTERARADVAGISTIETTPDGSRFTRTLSGTLKTFTELENRGFKIEETPDGFRARKGGYVIEVKFSPETKAEFKAIGKAQGEFLRELKKMPKNPTARQRQRLFLRLQGALMGLFVFLNSTTAYAFDLVPEALKTWWNGNINSIETFAWLYIMMTEGYNMYMRNGGIYQLFKDIKARRNIGEFEAEQKAAKEAVLGIKKIFDGSTDPDVINFLRDFNTALNNGRPAEGIPKILDTIRKGKHDLGPVTDIVVNLTDAAETIKSYIDAPPAGGVVPARLNALVAIFNEHLKRFNDLEGRDEIKLSPDAKKVVGPILKLAFMIFLLSQISNALRIGSGNGDGTSQAPPPQMPPPPTMPLPQAPPPTFPEQPEQEQQPPATPEQPPVTPEQPPVTPPPTPITPQPQRRILGD
ncbi:MAG: hypothetical protein WC285_03060 [Candidatus Gracilibacteria bacterium]|jgi:hypothetical protein